MKKVFFFIGFLLVVIGNNISADTLRIKVSESTPIYKRSIVEIPKTSYVEEQVQVPYRCQQDSIDTNSIGIDTIIGGIAGVAIGNQIGKGNGRTVAKIIGGITGASIANNLRGGEKICYRMEFRKIPITHYDEEIEERLIGYKNCGYIGSKKICKKTKTKKKYIYLSY